MSSEALKIGFSIFFVFVGALLHISEMYRIPYLSLSYSKFAEFGKTRAIPTYYGMLFLYFLPFISGLSLIIIEFQNDRIEISSPAFISTALFEVHFFKRCLESIFVHKVKFWRIE